MIRDTSYDTVLYISPRTVSFETKSPEGSAHLAMRKGLEVAFADDVQPSAAQEKAFLARYAPLIDRIHAGYEIDLDLRDGNEWGVLTDDAREAWFELSEIVNGYEPLTFGKRDVVHSGTVVKKAFRIRAS